MFEIVQYKKNNNLKSQLRESGRTPESVGGFLGGVRVSALSWAPWPEGQVALLSSLSVRRCKVHAASPVQEPPEREVLYYLFPDVRTKTCLLCHYHSWKGLSWVLVPSCFYRGVVIL